MISVLPGQLYNSLLLLHRGVVSSVVWALHFGHMIITEQKTHCVGIHYDGKLSYEICNCECILGGDCC